MNSRLPVVVAVMMVFVAVVACLLPTSSAGAQSGAESYPYPYPEPEPSATAVLEPSPTSTVAPSSLPSATIVPSPSIVPQPGQLLTFAPIQLGLDAPEIVNPLRGLYSWRRQEYAEQPRPSLDAYDRYTWRELEPTQGDYRFATLEAAIAKAAQEGRKFAFRVRTVVSTKGSSVPDYVMGGAGWWADYNHDGNDDTYVPDWNDPLFLDRAQAFITALGRRYDGDPRIAFVDIGMYGNWGEWHMASFHYPSDTGAQRATAAAKYRIIDMHIAAFPTTPLVMLTDDTDGLVYAMGRSTRIGWRRDSLGWVSKPHFEKIERDPRRWEAVKDRWKTALVVTEFVNPRQQSDPAVYQKALEQVQRYHISLVSNANTLKWSSLSPEGKAAFIQLGKSAGYRIALSRITMPTVVAAGSTFDLRSQWSNAGVAPVYEPWNVHVQLRDLSGSTIVWETALSLDLRRLLPGEPLDSTEHTTMGAVKPGQYAVVVVVVDPRRTRLPLALAIAGARSDGSYQLGTITVR